MLEISGAPYKAVIGGIRIYTDLSLVDHHSMQFRYPKSKKKRIRQKFAKKYVRRWTTPKEEVYRINSPSTPGVCFICHPDILRRFEKQLNGVKV